VWLIGLAVVVQLWLVAGSLEALLAGDTRVLLPAAGASLALFALSGGVLTFALHLDRRLRHDAEQRGRA
jgi:hypothetical protein